MINFFKITAFFILLFSFSLNANAHGIGIYNTLVNTGSATWDPDFSNNTFKTDIDHKEIGFVYDTAIARKKLFNYRLQIGYVKASYDESKFKGYIFTNSFGFGVYKTENLRLWLGPQIGYKRFDSDSNNQVVYLAGVELGVVLGLNYHFNDTLSLTLEAAHKEGFSAEFLNSNSSQSLFTIDENRSYINIGLLYRFNDVYK